LDSFTKPGLCGRVILSLPGNRHITKVYINGIALFLTLPPSPELFLNRRQFHYIIDAMAPFVLPRLFTRGQVINWSKVPYSLLERNGAIPALWRDQIIRRFDIYASRVAELGYNALSIDDLAHLSFQPSYSSNLQEKIRQYNQFFEKLFSVAEKHSLNLYINSDAAFAPAGITITPKTAIDSMVLLCNDLFVRYPTVKGVILRLGECDGVDVKGEILSNLTFQRAVHVRTLIRELVKLFDYHKRLLIVRTWTVGAYEIGDLMWNPVTYEKVFGGTVSDNLIVSHKFGDSDFYRYLSLNPLIFYGEQRKIVEFQTRREYEGFGEFPSFVGYDYEQYRNELNASRNIAGIHVWCQTGGWSKFHRSTFMPGSSLWNEINTVVTVKLFKEGKTADEQIVDFALKRFPGRNPEILQNLLKLSDEVIKQLWYIPEFSQRVLFFRRLRIPPLLWIFWDTIIINTTLRRILRYFTINKQETIDNGFRILENIIVMKRCAEELGIDTKDFDFQYATFELLARIRKFILSDWSPGLAQEINETIGRYTSLYPYGFSINNDSSTNFSGRRMLSIFLGIVLRNRPQYRLMEQKVFWLSLIIVRPIVHLWGRKRIPRFASERAMGIETLLK
jgi:hypothetical protein